MKDRNGRIFLDVDPEWIEVVINVLRDTGRIVLPRVAPEKDSGFRAILACYNLGSLFSDFTIDLSEVSDIGSMNDRHNREILHSFLRPELAEEKLRRFPLKLLYRFPRDGAHPAALHSKCQGNGHTLTVIEDMNGSVLGCYAEGKWNLSSPVVEGKKSFFFCLTTNPPEKLDLFATRPFVPDTNPVNTMLHFGSNMHMGTVHDACCDIGCFVGGYTSGTVQDLIPKAYQPKKIEVYQIEGMTATVGVDPSTSAQASTSGDLDIAADMAFEADGEETELASKIAIASLIMTDKMTEYNETIVARLRALSESIFKAERELLMELLLVRQLTSPASSRDISAGLKESWEIIVDEISAIDSTTCGSKQSDMIKELLLKLNVTGEEVVAVAVALVAPDEPSDEVIAEAKIVVECEEVISFNVGGTIIAVLKSTLLRQAPDSVFASRVSDRWRKSADEIFDGHICLVSK